MGASRQVLLAIRAAYQVDKLDCERLLNSSVGTVKPFDIAQGLRLPTEAPASSVVPQRALQAKGNSEPCQSNATVEPHQSLAALCISRGYILRFDGFESAPGGFRCVFRVEYRG